MRFSTIAMSLAALAGVASGSTPDICDPASTGFTADQQAVACYSGNFLVKMLTELNGGDHKTEVHVRNHLLPYLGGVATLNAARTDSIDDGECTVCFSDSPTADGLTGLRNSLTRDQLQHYDSLSVCYPKLTDRIMDSLPTSDDGVWLQADQSLTPFEQTVSIFKDLFDDQSYTTSSCKVKQTPSVALVGATASTTSPIANPPVESSSSSNRGMFNLGGPLHASCKATYTFNGQQCQAVLSSLQQAAKDLGGQESCGSGQKCLYTVKEADDRHVKLSHETPVKHYTDTLTFTVNSDGGNCVLDAKSSSDTWYAVLDSGTNYCNLHNLVEATGIQYSEQVSASVCTQLSSADCEKY